MALSSMPSGLLLVEHRAADGGPILLGGTGGGSLGAAAAAPGEAGGRGGGVVRENGGRAGAEGAQGEPAEEIAFVQADVAFVLGLDDLSQSPPPSGAADDIGGGGAVGRLKQRQDDVGTLYITTRRVVWLSAQDSRVGYAVDFLSLGVHALCRDSESYPRPCIYMQIDRPEDDDVSSDEDDEDEGGEEEEEEEEAEGEDGGKAEEDHNTMRESGDAGRRQTATAPADAATASTASSHQAGPASLVVGAEGLRDSAQDAAGAVVAAAPAAAAAAATGSAAAGIHGRDGHEEQRSSEALGRALAQVSEVRLVPTDPTCLDVVFKNLCLCAALNPDPVGEREGEGDWYFNEEEVQESMGVGAAEGDVLLGHPLQVDGLRPQPHANGELLLDEHNDDRFEDADEDEEME